MDEQALIKEIRAVIERKLSQRADLIGDDAAELELEAGTYCFSSDVLVEGQHFDERVFAPYDIGWKSVAVNLSDMAAMAAHPHSLTINLALNRNIADRKAWLQAFYEGVCDCILDAATQLSSQPLKILGGDLVAADLSSVSISIIGAKQHAVSTKRSNAKVGDKIAVSGKFGNSRSMLDFWLKNQHSAVFEPVWKSYKQDKPDDAQYFLRPKARLDLAQIAVADNESLAMMDASDGLAQALMEISAQSGVAIEIDGSEIPHDKHISREQMLYGGEDFELVIACNSVPPGFIEIGQVLQISDENSGLPLVWDTSLGERLTPDKIYAHF